MGRFEEETGLKQTKRTLPRSSGPTSSLRQSFSIKKVPLAGAPQRQRGFTPLPGVSTFFQGEAAPDSLAVLRF